MGLKKATVVLIIMTMSWVVYLLVSHPVSLPQCQSFTGVLSIGEEETTFNFRINPAKVELITTFNPALQRLGMPHSIRYDFDVVSIEQTSDLWRFHLMDQQHQLEQVLEIESLNEHYAVRWIGDRKNTIHYSCMDVKNAEI